MAKLPIANNTGFTIIELMIATAIFSVILLLLTTGMIQIGRVYIKGITSAQTQEAARSAMDEISRGIQFGGATITPTSGTTPKDYFCLGNKVYSFLKGRQLNDSPAGNQRKNVLVADSSATATCGLTMATAMDANTATVVAPGQHELLVPNMRLAKLEVIDNSPTDNLYTINIRVVYGDDDLLCSPSVAGDCNSNAVSTSLGNPDLSCKSVRAGTQFCAVSALSTVVQKRI